MYSFQQEGTRTRTGSVRHRDVLARLLAITRRQFTAAQPAIQPPTAPLPVCDGAGFEDRLHASLATLGRNDGCVAGVPLFGRAPLRSLDRNREQGISPGPNGGLVAWIEFNALEAVEPVQAERAADEMRALVRKRIDECGGDGFIGRYGAESFAWAQVGAMALEQAVALADAMLEALSTSARLASTDVSLCPSLGFSWFPEDGTSPAMLLSRACAAMRRARHYRMGYAFYSPILDTAFASPVGITCGMAQGSRRTRTGRTANAAMA